MAITKLPRNGIADNSINASKIEDGTIAIAEVSGTISNAKIKDGEIANAKLSNSAITIRGTSRALGTSVTIGVDVDWQSKITSDGSTVTTLVAQRGYFVDNSSAAGIVKLPTSATAGDTIKIKDYAGNFGTNVLVIQRNGHNIQGVANDGQIQTNRAAVTLVYVDSTKGWLYIEESNVGSLGLFTTATGGTVSTVGDFKIHAFTGDGNFVVSQAGSTADYLVVAGGGGGGADRAGGGGAGGFRIGSCFSLSQQTYPITVGGGGTAGTYPNPTPGGAGSNSIFSTITSAGGGAGAASANTGGNGGSGGGGGGAPPSGTGSAGGSGNTPPVSPSQGNNGGTGSNPNPGGVPTDTRGSGGGGGAGAVGGNAVSGAYPGSGAGGDGGAGGNATPVFGSSPQPFYGPTNGVYSGGGGGGTRLGTNTGGDGGTGGGGDGGDPNAPTAGAGGANTGGGGGGAEGGPTYDGAAGGKGIVLIRYRFQ